MSTKLITYTGLLNDFYYRSKEIDTLEVTKLVEQAGAVSQQLLPKGIFHVIDYTKRSHVGISGQVKEMMGWKPRDVLDNGLDFVIGIFQKDDFKVFNEFIFAGIVEKLKLTACQEHGDLIFSFNYRMKTSEGNWKHLYQQCCYITDPVSKLPVYNTGILTDITPFKKDNRMIFSIDARRKGESFLHTKNIATEYFYPDPEECQLSKREKEVLGWLAEGYSSKQVADKLYLSESTVIIHRKNMLQKTNTKNIAELINYAIRHGLI